MTATATLLCLTGLLTPPISHLQGVNEEWRTHTAVGPLQQVNEAWDTHRAAPLTAQASKSPARGMGSDVEQWRSLVDAHFGDLGAVAVETALCLMARESGGNPTARNVSSGATGLMQVLPSWAPRFGLTRSDLEDPEINLWVSRQLYDDGGWGHWSPYNRGECHL
ncbi:MAG TPA: lytic transglycosylase domain-containing protein [Acidimicrobiia bacterium]|nr:lytic transglycosylase domain-containing protein [Acidimicrobiia bacterium]